MPRAYSEDLRCRVVWSKRLHLLTDDDIARQFFNPKLSSEYVERMLNMDLSPLVKQGAH